MFWNLRFCSNTDPGSQSHAHQEKLPVPGLACDNRGLPGHTRRELRESLSLHHPDVGKLPASLSLSFAICEMGAQGFDSIVLMFSYGTIPLGCDILGQPRDTRGIPTDHLPLSTGR